jgi:hypothetical protein
MASEIKVDTISEKTSANGITIDGVNIKDSALATAGSVPLSTIDIDGGTDIGAAVVDADLFIIDDGAGGTNRKVTASRLKTYAGTTINNATANEIVTIGSTTTELDAEANLTFSGSALQCTATLTVGVDDTGHDVKFFGATASSYMLWDESADDLNLVASGLGVGTVGIKDLGTGIHVKVSDTGASATSNSDQLVLEKSGNSGLSILSSTSTSGLVSFGDSGDNDIGQLEYNHSDNSMRFTVNADEAMRIASTHSFNFNYGNNNNGAVTMYVNAQHDQTGLAIRSNNTGDRVTVAFTDGQDQACGSISVNGSGNTVTYSTSSDYRLKENVNYDFDATTELKKLKPAKFNWKTNPILTVEGFIAHEVSGIVPLAVQGTKDETEVIPNGVYNANGNLQRKDVSEDEWTKGKASGAFASNTTWSASKTIPKYQQIDQSKLVPLLVKTIQELEARITTLEG